MRNLFRFHEDTAEISQAWTARCNAFFWCQILAAHRLELCSELRPILSYVFVERIFNVSNFIVSFSLSGSRHKTLV